MTTSHQFQTNLSWIKPENTSLALAKRTFKNHTVTITHKAALAVSAAKSFKGDGSLHNPEDLLLSSLSSCHFMSYLYCCAQHNIDVIAYTDAAEATLQVNSDGSGKIIQVVLNPVVLISDPSQQALALALHQQASKLCFIANSCNFLIMHHPTCKVL